MSSRVHNIKLKENAQPVVHACQKVSFKLRNQLKKELDQMKDMEVIQKIYEPTEWVNS